MVRLRGTLLNNFMQLVEGLHQEMVLETYCGHFLPDAMNFQYIYKAA